MTTMLLFETQIAPSLAASNNTNQAPPCPTARDGPSNIEASPASGRGASSIRGRDASGVLTLPVHLAGIARSNDPGAVSNYVSSRGCEERDFL